MKEIKIALSGEKEEQIAQERRTSTPLWRKRTDGAD